MDIPLSMTPTILNGLWPVGLFRLTSQLMKVYSSMANVSRIDEIIDHIRCLDGWRISILAQNSRMIQSRTMEDRPIEASTCVLGRPLSELMITLYGASLVFTPVIPIATGN